MRAKRVIDLSWLVNGQGASNPAFPAVAVNTCLSYEKDGWMAEIVTAATHVGTHIDAPAHRIRNGKTVSDYPLERFQGEAVTVDLYYKKQGEEITVEDLKPYNNKIKQGDIVLLCTGWGYKREETDSYDYIYNSPWLGGYAAEYLVQKGVNAVGIDHFSIGGAKPENVCKPHDVLLSADVLVFEDLMLPRCLLEKERWYIAAFPIHLGNTSGSFARVVALDFEEHND